MEVYIPKETHTVSKKYIRSTSLHEIYYKSICLVNLHLVNTCIIYLEMTMPRDLD